VPPSPSNERDAFQLRLQFRAPIASPMHEKTYDIALYICLMSLCSARFATAIGPCCRRRKTSRNFHDCLRDASRLLLPPQDDLPPCSLRC
jgi:hypothetical protein